MTDYPINKYAHVAIDHINTKETHIGRLIHVRFRENVLPLSSFSQNMA